KDKATVISAEVLLIQLQSNRIGNCPWRGIGIPVHYFEIIPVFKHHGAGSASVEVSGGIYVQAAHDCCELVNRHSNRMARLTAIHHHQVENFVACITHHRSGLPYYIIVYAGSAPQVKQV